jgi:hypothetical protein
MEPVGIETPSPAFASERASAASRDWRFVLRKRLTARRLSRGSTRTAAVRLTRVAWAEGDSQTRASRAADRRLAALLAELADESPTTMPALLARAIARCQDDPSMLEALAREIARLSPQLAAMANVSADPDGSDGSVS